MEAYDYCLNRNPIVGKIAGISIIDVSIKEKAPIIYEKEFN